MLTSCNKKGTQGIALYHFTIFITPSSQMHEIMVDYEGKNVNDSPLKTGKEQKAMKNYRVFVILIALILAMVCPGLAGEKFPVKVGDMELDYTPRGGFRVSVFGTSFIGSSSFVVVSPSWVIAYYKINEMDDFPDNVTIQDIKKGKRIVIRHKARGKNVFEGTQTITLLENNTLKNEFEMKFLKKIPAIMEWKVGGINPLPIIGNAFVASDDKSTTRGVIPIKAESARVDASMVAKSFAKLKLDSRLGTITIETDPKARASFFDYRKNRWADVTDPIFWFGLLERPITTGKKYQYAIEFKFPEQRPSENLVQKKEYKPEIDKVSDAMRPHWGDDVIIPEPKQLKWSRDRFMLDKEIKILVPSGMKKFVATTLDFLTGKLASFYHLSPEIVEMKIPKEFPENMMVIAKAGDFTKALERLPIDALKPPEHQEGYSVYVDEHSAIICANNPKGLFYGVTTLVQMIMVKDGEMFIQGGRIKDYPALDFRGVHCLSGKGRGDEIAKAIKHLMAGFKMNHLVWECEYIIWDSHPELEHEEYGMKKSDAKKVVDAAKKYFMELIPLVQSLGHSEWIFHNGHNLDIAEDPNTPYAYSPSNPRTYEFIFEVYQEALDFFKPDIFHIGHDEVTMRGRFPYRSKDSGKSVTDLVLEDVNKLHDWFAKRDVRIMLWGDMFLWKGEASSAAFADTKEEAKIRRDRLPKDTFIADWHYEAGDPARYTSLKIFKQEGFEACGASWFNPKNIRNLTLGCKMFDAAGLLQTTWAGFNFKIDGNQEAWFQYWAYLWAAWYSWTGSDIAVDDLPFLASQTFLDTWSERKPVLEKKKGFGVNLDKAANRTLSDNARREGWVGMGPDYDISLPEKDYFGEMRFDIPTYNGKPGALLMAGNLNPKGSYPVNAEISLKDVQADEIHFLMTAAFRSRDKTHCGEIKMHYADGRSKKIPLVYGKNFFNFQDARVGESTRIAWWNTEGGETQCLHDLVWRNPRPDKKITRISLKSHVTDSAPALIAITGVGD